MSAYALPQDFSAQRVPYIQVVQWLLRHAPELPAVMAAAQAIAAAPTVADKLRAGIPLLDVLSRIADDMPTFSLDGSLSAADEQQTFAAAQAAVEAAGFDWQTFLTTYLPIILQIVRALLGV